MHVSKFADVDWEDPADPTIIRLTLRKRWSLAHILEAKSQIADRMSQQAYPVGLIIYWENSHWIPPYFTQIMAELTTDLHPNIAHIVFVSKDHLFKTAYHLVARSVSTIMVVETIEAAREYLRSMQVARSR